MIDEEFIILAGAFVWGICGVILSVQKDRFDSAFPVTFFSVAVLGGIIGVTETVPEPLDLLLTLLAAVLFFVVPIGLTIHLHQRTPRDDGGRGGNRTRERRHGRTDGGADSDSGTQNQES